MKQPWRFLACVVVFVVLAWYVGAMFDFLPFFADDLTVRAVGFATLILSIVIAGCTILLLKKGE